MRTNKKEIFMVSSIRVASSYLHIVSAENMTREGAQKIVDKMDPKKLEKIKKLLQPFQRLFKRPFNKKDAALIDVFKKINKTTGIPVAEIMAVAMILFGVASPTFADPSSTQDTKIEQVKQERPITEIQKDLGKVFELPSGLMNLVKFAPQSFINNKGIEGFKETVGDNLLKSLTSEVAKLLYQIPQDQWPEVLSGLAIQEILETPKVNEKFRKFMEDQKTNETNMAREIATVVNTNLNDIKSAVYKAVGLKSLSRV